MELIGQQPRGGAAALDSLGVFDVYVLPDEALPSAPAHRLDRNVGKTEMQDGSRLSHQTI